MRVVCLLAVFVLPSAALARPRHPAPSEPPAQRINIDDPDLVEGGTHGPGGSAITAATPPRHSSLIRVRTDFTDELLRSAEGE